MPFLSSDHRVKTSAFLVVWWTSLASPFSLVTENQCYEHKSRIFLQCPSDFQTMKVFKKIVFLKLTNYLWIKSKYVEKPNWKSLTGSFYYSAAFYLVKTSGEKKWGQWIRRSNEIKYRKMLGKTIHISPNLICKWSHRLIPNFLYKK